MEDTAVLHLERERHWRLWPLASQPCEARTQGRTTSNEACECMLNMALAEARDRKSVV